jgi:hypothetical protein
MWALFQRGPEADLCSGEGLGLGSDIPAIHRACFPELISITDNTSKTGADRISTGLHMINVRNNRRRKTREEFARLKNAAIDELERRGYNVRGKTPNQIRQALKRRPKSADARNS